MPMHALCKTLFFTTGTVGLLILVFLWSALKYGLFKLNHLIETILTYQFAGFYLTEFLLLPSDAGPGLKIHTIKLVVTAGVGIGSIFLIILSYLPKLSWQLKSLSFGIALFLFFFLSLFWLNLSNGHEVIINTEKNAIFGFTVVTYLIGVFSIWYAMRKTPVKTLKKSSQEIITRPPIVQSDGEKTAKSVEQKEDASTGTTLAQEDAPKAVAKDEEVKTPETFKEVDSTAESDTDGNNPDSLVEESVDSEEETEPEFNETEEQSDSEPSNIEGEQGEFTDTGEDSVAVTNASEESESIKDMEKTPELADKNPV